MPNSVGPSGYHEGLNEQLLSAVPAEASRILEVGCANGNLGARLKHDRSDRTVYGIELDHDAAAVARKQLDAVFEFDVERELPPVATGSLDCILFGDVLEHLVDPWSVLERYRPLLAPSGQVLCSIPNIQHHSVIRQIVRGDFQYLDRGLLDQTHLRFFTFATVFKMLLDAGFEPQLVDTIDIGDGDALIDAAELLMVQVRADPVRTRRFMNAQQLIVRGRPMMSEDMAEQPLTFVACVNDEAQLKSNLLRSPCLRGDSPHEVLLFRDCRSAAEGLNEGIRQAQNELVVLLHQDVYLPRGWPGRLVDQWTKASEHSELGIAGVFGSRQRPVTDGTAAFPVAGHVGRVVDRDHLHATDDRGSFPAQADYLDELLMVVPRSTPLVVDSELGWHLYGTDLCLQAQRLGLSVAVVDALCMHNSLTGSAGAEFRHSEEVLARKWPDHLPIHTVVSSIYGAPERRAMERIESERAEAVEALARIEGERDAALAEVERVQLSQERALEEADDARGALDAIRSTRTWQAHDRVVGWIDNMRACLPWRN